ncbi:MAG: class I tRNA ligase family protein, partial [Calditrichia bacterium]|nr:class I tRNA ligase family protein [Calditrichia bacterium]
MSNNIEKTYEPGEIEEKWYQTWLDKGYFSARKNTDKKPYTIVIPPPNVTAPLHMGHAFNNTIQDILIRFKRKKGFEALWLPGTDHAGIATQNVVEKKLQAENTSKHELGRKKFIEAVWDWKKQYGSRIIFQLKKMGCSCDWDRERFTMDEGLSGAVQDVFISLYEKGLIYRGNYIINWCPRCETALSDEEVEYQTHNSHLWHMKYPVKGKDTFIVVATTRPETMLGDTAVAVNPSDPRAKALVGKQVRLPLVGRLIPIVADELVVLPDPESDDEKARFSTGFLKVTPAHDPNDFQIGQRHDLPIINVMAPDASISPEYGRHGWEDADAPEARNLLGMDRFEAREAIVEWFRKENLL